MEKDVNMIWMLKTALKKISKLQDYLSKNKFLILVSFYKTVHLCQASTSKFFPVTITVVC